MPCHLRHRAFQAYSIVREIIALRMLLDLAVSYANGDVRRAEDHSIAFGFANKSDEGPDLLITPFVRYGACAGRVNKVMLFTMYLRGDFALVRTFCPEKMRFLYHIFPLYNPLDLISGNLTSGKMVFSKGFF